MSWVFWLSWLIFSFYFIISWITNRRIRKRLSEKELELELKDILIEKIKESNVDLELENESLTKELKYYRES